MIFNKNTFLKTAAIAAVFYFLSPGAMASPGSSGPLAGNGLEIVKRKAINLMMQAQKKQAINVVSDYLNSETNKALVKDAKEFRLNVAKKFLNKESQEAYETSINLTLENPKQALKSVEECLLKDSENLDCLIQRIRLTYRSQKSPIKPSDELLIKKYFENPDINWVKLSTEKQTPEFKTQNFYKKEFARMSEEKLVLAALEMDRSLAVKNFSKAKEVLLIVGKEFPDWPELVFFKNQIDLESAENKAKEQSDLSSQYQSKCKALTKSVIRKFRYDFDLCLRGGK